jgi:hypothetical protein
MTRIKKRRTGKKRTADQKRMVAGRKRARVAEKTEPPKVQGHTTEIISAEKKAAYKKSLQPAQSNRRNRSSKKVKPEKTVSNEFRGKSENKNTGVPGKATGKTRSAGSRRIAVAKSVVSNFKSKVTQKKAFPPKKEVNTNAERKPSKGFAPWNKNKFKRKEKGS